VWEHFTDLRDTEVRMEISLGDDTIFRVVGCGIVTFQRDGLPHISFKDVLYVPGLKNLISVSTLQDRDIEVSFRGTKVLIHPKGSCLTSGQVIRVRDGKLFKFLFQPLRALAASSDSINQLCELWHQRMAHLHHGALGGLREVVTGVPQFSSEHQDVCRGCVLGKITKDSFPNSDNRSTRVLDLVHVIAQFVVRIVNG
jgi:hypothetical protein